MLAPKTMKRNRKKNNKDQQLHCSFCRDLHHFFNKICIKEFVASIIYKSHEALINSLNYRPRNNETEQKEKKERSAAPLPIFQRLASLPLMKKN